MVGRILGTAPLTGENATKDEVLKRLSSVALVHISAHGRMETGEILLAPSPSTRVRTEKLSSYNDRCVTSKSASEAGLC